MSDFLFIMVGVVFIGWLIAEWHLFRHREKHMAAMKRHQDFLNSIISNNLSSKETE